jgi:hypothetical protein
MAAQEAEAGPPPRMPILRANGSARSCCFRAPASDSLQPRGTGFYIIKNEYDG